MDSTASQAYWEIRSGVSARQWRYPAGQRHRRGHANPYGAFKFWLLDEYTIQVTGLNVNLGPGTYWLNVCPIDSGTGRSFNSTTVGANAIGQPPGNDVNSFFDSTFFGMPSPHRFRQPH